MDTNSVDIDELLCEQRRGFYRTSPSPAGNRCSVTVSYPSPGKVTMASITDSEPTDRLIKLLMMLPSPYTEDTFAPFWDRVAQDLGSNTSTDYVTGKISVHLRFLLGNDSPTVHRERLASYALFFFGQASDQLLRTIASEVNMGAPNDTAGRLWVQELRNTAFAVMEETFPQERVHEAIASWVQFDR